MPGARMSIERRTELLEALDSGPRYLQRIVSERASLIEGNWDLAAYAYQLGFEALWDHAIERANGEDAERCSTLVVLPLLMLWRQSVELSIKSAIEGTTGRQPLGGHDLTTLFARLVAARRERGDLESDDNDYTAEVMGLIAEFQSLDARADRWRYPTKKGGRAHVGVTVDLNRLFQAHALITGWCDGASVEAEHANYHRRPSTA